MVQNADDVQRVGLGALAFLELAIFRIFGLPSDGARDYPWVAMVGHAGAVEALVAA